MQKSIKIIHKHKLQFTGGGRKDEFSENLLPSEINNKFSYQNRPDCNRNRYKVEIIKIIRSGGVRSNLKINEVSKTRSCSY